MIDASNSPGIDSTYVAKPADTNAAAIYTVPTGVARAQLIGITSAANGASNITISINDGSADYQMLWTYALGANTSRTDNFGYPVMQAGWSLKVTTSNANNASFVATVRELVI